MGQLVSHRRHQPFREPGLLQHFVDAVAPLPAAPTLGGDGINLGEEIVLLHELVVGGNGDGKAVGYPQVQAVADLAQGGVLGADQFLEITVDQVIGQGEAPVVGAGIVGGQYRQLVGNLLVAFIETQVAVGSQTVQAVNHLPHQFT